MISDRELLEEKERELKREYESKDVERPPHWGGFRLVPNMIEFWKGRESRLHDRIVFTRETEGADWSI